MSRCNKCIEKKFTFLKVHPCLHDAGCVVKDAETLPKPRSVSWAPDKCVTCSSWLDRLRRSCLSVDDRSSLCSLLRAIVDRRRKSRVPEKSLWNIFPSENLRAELSPFFSFKSEFLPFLWHHCEYISEELRVEVSPFLSLNESVYYLFFGITVKISFPTLPKFCLSAN